jgi:hypothetical protein
MHEGACVMRPIDLPLLRYTVTARECAVGVLSPFCDIGRQRLAYVRL